MLPTPQPETVTAALTEIEFTLFEKFVDLTDVIWWALEANPVVKGLVSALIILAVWSIFRYHEGVIKNHEFFDKNIHIGGRFCKPTYDTWRTIAMTLLPIGLCVIFFSFITRFKTEPFAATFGIKGVSKVKELIIKKALKESRLKR